MPASGPAPPGSSGAEPGKCPLQTFNEITGGIDFFFFFLMVLQTLEIVPLGNRGGGQKEEVRRELYWTRSYLIF